MPIFLAKSLSPASLNHLRLIFLVNWVHKLVTRVLISHLASVIDSIIVPSRPSFKANQSKMDGQLPARMSILWAFTIGISFSSWIFRKLATLYSANSSSSCYTAWDSKRVEFSRLTCMCSSHPSILLLMVFHPQNSPCFRVFCMIPHFLLLNVLKVSLIKPVKLAFLGIPFSFLGSSVFQSIFSKAL